MSAAWLRPGWVSLTATSGLAADLKPNFLYSYPDDDRRGALGVVQKGQDKRARFPWFKSPNLGRPARCDGSC